MLHKPKVKDLGRNLMVHLAAHRLLDPATTGTVLAVQGALIEEAGAATTSETMLIDMAVVVFTNSIRVRSMVGNTSLLI